MERSEKDQIIEQTGKLFLRYGVKSVSMDDIARDLGISKKTLYQYIDDKEELVHLCISSFLDGHALICQACLHGSENPIKRMLDLSQTVAITLNDINPSLLYDLQKYYSKSWKLFADFRHETIYSQIKENLTQGKIEGWYRDEINEEVIAHLYIGLMDLISNSEIFPGSQFRYRDLVTEFMIYHLNGVVSLKGKEYLIEHNEILNSLKQ